MKTEATLCVPSIKRLNMGNLRLTPRVGGRSVRGREGIPDARFSGAHAETPGKFPWAPSACSPDAGASPETPLEAASSLRPGCDTSRERWLFFSPMGHISREHPHWSTLACKGVRGSGSPQPPRSERGDGDAELATDNPIIRKLPFERSPEGQARGPDGGGGLFRTRVAWSIFERPTRVKDRRGKVTSAEAGAKLRLTGLGTSSRRHSLLNCWANAPAGACLADFAPEAGFTLKQRIPWVLEATGC